MGESEEIDVLLGADAWPYIMTDSIIRFEDDLMAINTKLGWSIIGSSKENTNVSSALIVILLTQAHLKNFWELETLGIKDPSIKKTQAERNNEVEDFFKETVTRNENGRYVVRLPWIEGHQELRPNKEIAQKRLLATTKKLKNLGRYENYDCVI
ncbi:Retrotransposon protein [Nesidiocoris tenuis]|uniref:Retrotransposon protein n=1 Tax=Nesidiocoris tenuis TaxID=355587 RepID=A0ABN7AB66_9HEMI|nr:Retrotransposon protein [Nesidiocoris tenuis]